MNTPDLSAVQWRKSSRSMGNGGQCVEVGGLWRKSSRSMGNGGDCVEVVGLSPAVAVRDSKDPDGSQLLFAAAHWQAFSSRVKAGVHDLG